MHINIVSQLYSADFKHNSLADLPKTAKLQWQCKLV